MDPTIPRHRRPHGSAFGTTFGWFVDNGQVVKLMDRHGNEWPLEQVSIQQGTWGFRDDGIARLPRPQRIDANGRVLVEGDPVRIDYIDHNPGQVLVSGGFRAVRANDFLPYNYETPKGRDHNRLAGRVAVLDDDGRELGALELEAGAEQKTRLQIAGAKSGDDVTSITLDAEDGSIVLERPNGVAVRVTGDVVELIGPQVHAHHNGQAVNRAYLEAFLEDMQGVLEELIAIGLGISSMASIAAPKSAEVLAKLAASLDGPGPPYLSQIVKVE